MMIPKPSHFHCSSPYEYILWKDNCDSPGHCVSFLVLHFNPKCFAFKFQLLRQVSGDCLAVLLHEMVDVVESSASSNRWGDTITITEYHIHSSTRATGREQDSTTTTQLVADFIPIWTIQFHGLLTFPPSLLRPTTHGRRSPSMHTVLSAD